MPDFGFGEALEKALAAAKKTSIVPPAEGRLAASAAQTAPTPGAAPVVPSAAPQLTGRVARVPSMQGAPPVEAAPPPETAVQAPQINPSVQPPDVPPPQVADAAATPTAQEAPPSIATDSDARPPVPQTPEPPVASPDAPPPSPDAIAPSNRIADPPAAEPQAPAQTPVQQDAARFVSANMNDFSGKLNMTHMPNVETMSTPNGVKAAILQIADDNKGAIETARRGTIGDEQLIGLAEDLSVNSDVVKQVMTREFGTSVQRPELMLAARMIEQQQVGSLASLAGKVADGTASNADIIQYQQHKQLVSQYITQLMGAKAEWGRAGRGLQIPVGLPDGVEAHLSNVFKQNNPDMQAEAQAIRLAMTPSGIANIVQGSLAYRAMVKAPFNVLQRVFINGILSGPPTWFKIIIGNNFNLALNSFDLFAAGIGRGMVGLAARAGGFPTAAEGATLSDAFAHVHGIISGGADALRVAGRVLKTGKSMDGIMRGAEDFGGAKLASGSDAILPELRDSYFGGIARVMGTVVDMPGRIIGSIDSFTRTLGERGYMTMMTMKDIRGRIQDGTLRPGDAGQIANDMMKNPSPEMQQAAAAWGARQTFQTPWPEGGVGQAFQTVLNKAPALRFIFPFMRTASNIFKQADIERTPLAIFSSRLKNQIAAGGFEGDLAKARIATGTALGSMWAWMAIHDRVTGDAPKDPKARAVWEADGRQPYSVRITNPITGQESWRSYAWFEPVATHVGVISDIVQLQSYLHPDDDIYSMMPEKDRTQDAIAHVMASIIQNTGNKTFMQGAAQFAEMYNDPQRAFSMWADQMGAATVPFSGALRFARNEQDPYLRQAFTLTDKIKDELPTLGKLQGSKTLEPRLDWFGEPRKTYSGNSILGPMNPMPGQPSVRDDVTDELQNLMEQTRTVPITMPSKGLAYGGAGKGLQDGGDMRLTPSEYYDYVTMARKDPIFNNGALTFRDKLQERINSPVYQAATPPERATMLESIQHDADKIGRERLYKENDDFRERMTEWTAENNRLMFNK